MAINVESVLGRAASAYTKAKSSLDHNREGNSGLQKFMEKITEYGTIVKARYEVSFSGIDDITFFVSDINVPNVRMNIAQLHYEGQMVEVPVNYEFEHDFNMTVLNDGKGLLYTTLLNFIMDPEDESILNSGYTMTLRVLGDGQNTDGMVITFNGVRFKSISGLTFASSDTGISTFSVACSAINFTATMGGKLSEIGGIAGAVGEVTGALGLPSTAKGVTDIIGKVI